MRTHVLLFALLAIPISCIAKPDEEVVKAMTKLTSLTAEEIRRDYESCGGNTYQMKVCGGYHWVMQDVRLNKIYKQVISKAKELGYEDSLLKSQRAWIAYRDTTCMFEGEFQAGGGTAEGLYVLSCKELLTKQRADNLFLLIKEE
jgi:uncharacterized protein YecT (DUF1311 family)